jgi:hypothetical protein
MHSLTNRPTTTIINKAPLIHTSPQTRTLVEVFTSSITINQKEKELTLRILHQTLTFIIMQTKVNKASTGIKKLKTARTSPANLRETITARG